MSWDQSYSVPSPEDLLLQLTGKNLRELLEVELSKQGIRVVQMEDILLDDSLYGEIKGKKVFLSDGRIFEPKLVRQEKADGNWGNDIYEYRLQNEEVKVENVDLTEQHEDDYYGGGVGNCGLDCGCENEGC